MIIFGLMNCVCGWYNEFRSSVVIKNFIARVVNFWGREEMEFWAVSIWV